MAEELQNYPDFLAEEVIIFLEDTDIACNEINRLLLDFWQVRDEQKVNEIFRHFHTIKGNAGSLEFQKLVRIAHSGESILDSLRRYPYAFTTELLSLLMRVCDVILEILGFLETEKNEGPVGYGLLFQKLEESEVDLNHNAKKRHDEAYNQKGVKSDVQQIFIDSEDSLPNLKTILYQLKSIDDNLITPIVNEYTKNSDQELAKALVKKGALTQALIDTIFDVKAHYESQVARHVASKPTEQYVRVPSGHFQRMMDISDHLIKLQMYLLKNTGNIHLAEETYIHKTIDNISIELRNETLNSSLRPLNSLCHKFLRVVQSLAESCNKQIKLVMEGIEETVLSSEYLDKIKSPLNHMLRNAVDHGIELPQERLHAGKAAMGLINLRAFEENDLVTIEICDDGKGVSPSAVKASAIRKKLISEKQAANMTDDELIQLIFEPGFTTTNEVTSISGRGVGMDVVMSTFKEVGGSVHIKSQPGFGTTLICQLPKSRHL